MKYITRNGAELSNMTLGTSQLGFNYGIANDAGMPDDTQGQEMLRYTLDNGITSIDTAQAYGESEGRIGAFIKSEKNRTPFITTKLRLGFGLTGSFGGAVLSQDETKSLEDSFSTVAGDLEKTVFEAAETSLKRLGLAKANCIILHDPLEMMAGGGLIAKTMGKLVTAGYANEVGVSVYHPAEADVMMQHDEYTVTQLPMNLFDQKMIHTGTLRKLKEKNFIVFVRSVFLQGLFFLDPDKVEDPLLKEYAVGHIRELRRLAANEGLSIAQLALSFVRDTEGVTSLVLGCDNTDQIRENIRLMEGPSVSEKTMHDSRELFKDVNYEGIMVVLRRPK